MELISIARPGFGTVGRSIQLRANHYPLKVPTSGSFFHYHVSMQQLGYARETGGGDAGSTLAASMGRMSMQEREARPLIVLEKPVMKDTKRKAMQVLIANHKNTHFGGRLPAFDGESNLFSPCEVKGLSAKTLTLDVSIPKSAAGRSRDIRVTFQACKPLETQWSVLQDAMQGRIAEVPVHIISCINTIFREAALSTDNNIPAGRSYFHENDWAFTLGGGRTTWVGFYASARPCQHTMSLNLDIAHCVFYEGGSLPQFIAKVLKAPTPPRDMTDAQRRLLMADLKGLRVETTHGGVPRHYTIKTLSREGANAMRFEHDGKQISIAEYFFVKYNIKLQYPGLPMVETANKTYVPLELCSIIKGQKVIRKLTDMQTADMVRRCAKPAPERMTQIQKLRDSAVNYETSEHLREFQISVEKTMYLLKGRVLDLPKIGQKNQKLDVQPMDGTWDGRRSQFLVPKNINGWALCMLDEKMPEQLLKVFLETLTRFGRDRGMKIAPPFIVPLESMNPDFNVLVRDLGQHFEEELKQNLDIIMFIVGGRHQYADIKKAGDVKWGVPTQVVLGQTIGKNADRGMPQLCGNLLLKMNAKLGGINNNNDNLTPGIAANSLLRPFMEQRTIVFGADVTHPGFGEDPTKPSIAAVVASMDQTFTDYRCKVYAQAKATPTDAVKVRSKTQEIITNLRQMVIDLMGDYYDKNGQKEPSSIIFFRDEVMNREVAAIREACAELGDNYCPPITYIVVGKRHHVRLFTENRNDATGRAMNVPPGSIADREIVHFSEFDFYLVSHGGIQGTSRPVHYHVISDDNKYSADQIQMFAFYLTFLYARCNRSVSIPTPVYYAHLAAFRARHHLVAADISSDVTSVANSSNKFGPASLNLQEMNERIKVNQYLPGIYFA